MKKKLIPLLFLPFGLFPLTLLGQISSGTTLIGGNFNLNVNNSKSDTFGNTNKYYSFTISPQIGYFVATNLVVGAGLGLSAGRQKNSLLEGYKQNGYTLGPFVRYYKFLGEKTAFFGNVDLSYAHNKLKPLHSTQESIPEETNENYGIMFTPGLVYFATSKVGFEVSLGSVGYYKFASERGINTPNFTKSINSGFVRYYGLQNSFLGVKFYLNR